jgi:hypothetical protein
MCEREKEEETADLSTPLRSGRDDKFLAKGLCATPGKIRVEIRNKFVVSTGVAMGL